MKYLFSLLCLILAYHFLMLAKDWASKNKPYKSRIQNLNRQISELNVQINTQSENIKRLLKIQNENIKLLQNIKEEQKQIQKLSEEKENLSVAINKLNTEINEDRRLNEVYAALAENENY